MTTSVTISQVSKIFSNTRDAVDDLKAAISSQKPANKSMQGKVVLNNVSINIIEGDRLGIIGRNGAGKSTLLHLIAGLSSPTSGQINVQGKISSVMTLGIGLREALTGRENIYIDGEIQGKSREEISLIINDIISFAELEEFIDAPLRTYSTGMKARLAFSMISYIDPEILIIDETLSVGDVFFAAKATKRIQEICAKGKIVIIVSHGMQSIKEICNRCVYLKDGRIVMDGTPDEVVSYYLDEVRGEDERALVAKFKSKIGKIKYKEGFKFKSIKLYTHDLNEIRHIIKVLETLRIRIVIYQDFRRPESLLNVKIVRLDEIEVFNEYFDTSVYAISDTEISMEIEFSKLLLGPALYRLDLRILTIDQAKSEELYATYSTIFEIATDNPKTGGKPMLYYDLKSEITPVS